MSLLKRLVRGWDETIQQQTSYLLQTELNLKLRDSLVPLPFLFFGVVNTRKRKYGENLPPLCIMHKPLCTKRQAGARLQVKRTVVLTTEWWVADN